MTWILLALLAGFGGGAWHLWLLSVRARRLDAIGLLLAPIALLGPVAAVGLVLLVQATAIWAVLPGLIVARVVLVPRLGRLLEGASWTR